MQIERRQRGSLEALDRDVSGRTLAHRRASAVATVDGAVGIAEEDRPGHREVELEARQIDTVHLDQTHADELRQDLLELLVFGDGQLVVQGLAGLSRNAAERDQQGFAALGRHLLGGRQVVVHPERRDVVL